MKFLHLLCALCLATPVLAEDLPQAPSIALELNTLTPLESGCRLTFLATNTMEHAIDKLVLESVLFNTDGSVDRLTLFDLQNLPQKRSRVRQFDIPGLTCEAMGRVLINGVAACTGEGVEANACLEALDVTSRTDVEVLG